MVNQLTQNESFKPGFSKVRWVFIVICLLVTVSTNLFYSSAIQDIAPIILAASFFIAAFLHGKERYGFKNITIFLLITWLVSNFFEALSIQTGFPFGYYYYQIVGPKIFEVPVIVMPAYFGMGYASWILSHILLGQYSQKLAGKQIFLIPFVAAFIMVMWDVCIDPLASTIAELWVWKEPGFYFGVPLQNYLGWFMVVYIFFQLFAFYIAKYEKYDVAKLPVFATKIFWMEAVAIYAVQALLQIMNPFTQGSHMEIYIPIAMITVFTMGFMIVLSCAVLRNMHLAPQPESALREPL